MRTRIDYLADKYSFTELNESPRLRRQWQDVLEECRQTEAGPEERLRIALLNVDYVTSFELPFRLLLTRIHTPFLFTKEIDSSSPYLYKAVTTGQTLKSAEFKWYKINDAGQEVEYFNTKLENVKVVKVNPVMHDIKNPVYEKHNHLEQVELRYEKITWTYKDGNIIHSDAWSERTTA